MTLRPPKIIRLLPFLVAAVSANCGRIGLDLRDELDGGETITSTDSSSDNGDGDRGGDDRGEGGSGPNNDSSGDDSTSSDLGGRLNGSGSSTGTGGEMSTVMGSGGQDAATGGSGPDGSGGSEGSGGGVALECEGGTEVDLSLVGWATATSGTSGGQGGVVRQVTTGLQLIQALDSKVANMPMTIVVKGTITPENTGSEKIDIKDVRDISIIGSEDGAEFSGIGLKLWRTGNVILRNLKIHHVAIGEGDAISIAGPADHVWVDHCELYNTFQGVNKETYDGLIDAKDDVEYLTYSWNKVHDSWNVHLVGSSELDVSDRKLTMHHNWIDNVNGETPSFRGGTGHIFNNLFSNISTLGINSRLSACLRVENNVFQGVQNPWVSAYSTVRGGVDAICNDLDSTSTFSYSLEVREAPACEVNISYDYADVLTETASVAKMVRDYAGVGHLTDSELY